MYIDKINNNRLEVLINMEDLENNNISWEDFMIDSQNLYPHILDTIFEKTNLRLNNYKIKIDSFFIMSKKVFVLIITRHSKLIRYNKTLKNNTFYLAKFKDFNTLCQFCLSINVKTISTLYFYNKYYYLKIKPIHLSNFKKIIFNMKEFADVIVVERSINKYKEPIIKNNAIEICKRLA